MKATEHEITQVARMLKEAERLRGLTNEELVMECLSLDAADYDVVVEMMNRLHPGWENANPEEINTQTARQRAEVEG